MTILINRGLFYLREQDISGTIRNTEIVGLLKNIPNYMVSLSTSH